MADACARVGRDPKDVTLVAVSKKHATEKVREAFEAGQQHFGENIAQELRDKHAKLENLHGLQWHFIGRFQSNKAKMLLRAGASVHSTAAPSHLDAIAQVAGNLGITARVLIQVNVGHESQKAGVDPADVGYLIDHATGLSNLNLEGLMVIPPASNDPERSRPYFAQLAKLAFTHNLTELSMGMSNDFSVAIEEGATAVRVGTAIFGAREDKPL